MELTSNFGIDAVLDFVNSTKSREAEIQFLRKRNRLIVIVIGLFKSRLNLNIIIIPIKAFRLIRSYIETLNELISLAERGIINPIFTDRFKLDITQLSQLKKFNIIRRMELQIHEK